MNEKNLLRLLLHYAKEDVYPFHMPGHKRNTALLGEALPYALDITEIDGFDNLHAPQGVLQRLNEQLARLWGSKESFALVNGSTCGILAGVASCVSPGETVLVARNCHRSVYHAIELTGARPVYLVPPVDTGSGIAGSITPEQVRCALQSHPNARLVVVTSPTYDGVISDMAGIVRAAHEAGVPVLADEAHGAHLVFTEQAERSAVRAGADIVIHSLHKTLPALTQCAAAHLCGTRVDPVRFQQALSMFETSSPSYVLLASIAQCADFLETKDAAAFAAYRARLSDFSERCRALERLRVLGKGADKLENHPAFFAFDSGKLPVVTAHTTLDGQALLEALRQDFAIEGEMAAISYALLMTSVCDTEAGFTRLFDALFAIDREAKFCEKPPVFSMSALPERRCSPAEAAKLSGRLCPLQEAAGKMSLEYVFCYPPGAPLLVPGEIVNQDMVSHILKAQAHGLSVLSTHGALPLLRVCD